MKTKIITCNKARFSVISEGLIRMEYSNGAFTDEPTLFAERGYAEAFEKFTAEGKVSIKTPLIDITYIDDGKPFDGKI